MKTKEKDQKDSTNEEQGNEKKKRKKNEIGCQCIIY